MHQISGHSRDEAKREDVGRGEKLAERGAHGVLVHDGGKRGYHHALRDARGGGARHHDRKHDGALSLRQAVGYPLRGITRAAIVPFSLYRLCAFHSSMIAACASGLRRMHTFRDQAWARPVAPAPDGDRRAGRSPAPDGTPPCRTLARSCEADLGAKRPPWQSRSGFDAPHRLVRPHNPRWHNPHATPDARQHRRNCHGNRFSLNTLPDDGRAGVAGRDGRATMTQLPSEWVDVAKIPPSR